MIKKFYLPMTLLLVISMFMGACGPTVVVEPTEVVVVTEAPTMVVTEAPVTLDVPALLSDFWASIPGDKGYGSVSAANLNIELADAAPFLVDVREVSEVESGGYIAGAINIPIRSLLENLDKLPGLDEPIVIYCGSGHRGALGMMALKMLGYTNVRNLGGGSGAWGKAGLEFVTGEMPAEPQAISTPIVADELLYTTLNDFLTGMPDNFYSIKADGLNTELAENPPFLLDVRSQAELDKDGYIEGSTSIPFADFLTSLDQVPAEKDARIVVYCASGHRGAMAEMALYLLGYTNVSNLGGGMGAWKAAGLPVAGWVDWAAVTGEFVSSLPADQGFYSIGAAPLNQMLAETPPFLVDVRETSEVEASGYIEGAINIPIRELLANLDKLPAQDQKIVIYCGSGHRGGLGMMALRLLGYTDVVNLGGGTGAWAKAQFAFTPGLPAAPVATGAVPTFDPLRLTKLNEYLMALPAGFNGVKAADLNAELASATVPVVLDVRTAAEVSADGYIEGALLIPIVDLPANLSQLPADKAAPIVVTCKSGHRGAIGMMYLNFLGYTNVRNLGGGMGAWIAAAFPVVK